MDPIIEDMLSRNLTFLRSTDIGVPMPAPKNESVRRCLVKEIDMIDSMISNSERDQRVYRSKDQENGIE